MAEKSKTSFIDNEAPKVVKKSKLGVGFFLILLVIFAFGTGMAVSDSLNDFEVIRITDTFVDVDGDNMVDYIVKADVIFNTGAVDFMLSQQNNP